MEQDTFVAQCEKLHLDFYKVEELIHSCTNSYELVNPLGISCQEAESVYDIYWSRFQQS